MKNTLRLEEAAMLILSFVLFMQLPISWWWFLVLILTPDISMLGYLGGNKTGAVTYNIFHHKGLAILIYIAGLWVHQANLEIAGLILLGHSSMDRMMGYGLKYDKGFKYTHLGVIGNN